MQRVLLVFPGVFFENAYPLGLASLAAAARRAGHHVEGCDLGLHGPDALRELLRARSYDWVGIAVWAANARRAAAAADQVRAHSRARLLVGGPHASLRPREVLAATGAHVALRGEADHSLVALLDASDHDEPVRGLPGTAWIAEDGRLVTGPPATAVVDLDALPEADRRVFPLRGYTAGWARGAPLRAPIVTSRGCPCSCAHCCAPALHHGRWRPRDPARVVQEMDGLRREHGVGWIEVEDEQPLVDRARFVELCERLASLPGELPWGCPNGLRPEQLDQDLLVAMGRAGCRQIALGIETPEPGQLARLGRHPELEPARAATRWAAEQGMDVTAYMMIGLPGAAPGASRAALRAARSLGVSSAHFSVYEPVPGAALEGGPPSAGLPWRLRRGLLYLGFYGHPGRARGMIRHAGAGVGDLPSAGRRLLAWLTLPGRERER
jgi:anaerobic magnesium-protoporphyrin IX monomethyl ester cyclase